MSEPEWYRANRANWDERVGVHIGPGGYDLSDLRAGRGKLNAIGAAFGRGQTPRSPAMPFRGG